MEDFSEREAGRDDEDRLLLDASCEDGDVGDPSSSCHDDTLDSSSRDRIPGRPSIIIIAGRCIESSTTVSCSINVVVTIIISDQRRRLIASDGHVILGFTSGGSGTFVLVEPRWMGAARLVLLLEPSWGHLALPQALLNPFNRIGTSYELVASAIYGIGTSNAPSDSATCDYLEEIRWLLHLLAAFSSV